MDFVTITEIEHFSLQGILNIYYKYFHIIIKDIINFSSISLFQLIISSQFISFKMSANPPSNTRLNIAGQQPPASVVRSQEIDPYSLRMRVTEQKLNFIQQHKILFLSGKYAVVDPQYESYWQMLKNTMCPSVQCLSLTSILLFLNAAVFIAELAQGLSSNTVLQVDYETLMRMGVNDSHKVYKGQVHRLLVAQFLHVNMFHFISNNLILILAVSRAEYSFGPIKVLVVYVLSGIAGGILSNIVYTDQMLKAGSSTSLYGIVGLSVGYLIVNWPALKVLGFVFKFKLFFIIIWIAGFLLLFTDVAISVDFMGHLGAFAAGILLIAIFPSIDNSNRQYALRIIFGILFIGQLLACFLGFYLSPPSALK